MTFVDKLDREGGDPFDFLIEGAPILSEEPCAAGFVFKSDDAWRE